MHPDLSPHLHSEECNLLIQQLKQCRDEHPWRKFTGYCDVLDNKVWKCCKAERLARRDRNRVLTKERQEALKQDLFRKNPDAYKK